MRGRQVPIAEGLPEFQACLAWLDVAREATHGDGMEIRSATPEDAEEMGRILLG